LVDFSVDFMCDAKEVRVWSYLPATTKSGAALLTLCMVTGPTQAQTGTDQVIVVTQPTKKSSLQTLPSRFTREIQKQALAMTGSEVWSVPKAHTWLLIKRLEQRGYKVIHLENGWNHILMQPKEAHSLGPAQQAVVNKAIGMAETVNLTVLKMPNAAVIEHALTYPEGKIVLPLAQGRNITLARTQTTVRTQKGLSWRGLVEETGEKAALMFWNDGRLSGYFAYNGRLLTVTNIGGNVHALAEMDAAKLPPDHPPSPQSKSADSSPIDRSTISSPASSEPEVPLFSDAERKALEAKKITIDVMILYTKFAASHYIRHPADILALAIEEANESFRNSGLGNITLRLVHSQAIDYDGRGDDHFTHLYRMVDGVGPLKDLKRLRNEKRADIVGLVIDNPHGCGLSTRVGPDSEEAFFVVHHSCALISYSITHEIGHIIGARHDRTVDPMTKPYAYAHGYINGSKWRTLMSYKDGCSGCPRIPYWSNPRIMYMGEPTGTTGNDAARVILQEAERVSKFR
jgi:peptidyl-Asp metalloendopeptidase